MKLRKNSSVTAAHNIVSELVHQLDDRFIPGGGPRGEDVVTRKCLMEVLGKYLIGGTAKEPRQNLPTRIPLTLEFDELRALTSLVDSRFDLYTIGPVERRKRIERLARLRKKLWSV